MDSNANQRKSEKVSMRRKPSDEQGGLGNMVGTTIYRERERERESSLFIHNPKAINILE